MGRDDRPFAPAKEIADYVTGFVMGHFDDFVPARFIHSENGIVITDAAGRILWFNPAFHLLCGYDFDEVKGRKPGSFLQGPASDPAVVREMRDAVNAGMPCEVELVNYHKNGRPYTVHIRIEPVRNEKGAVKFFAAIEREFDEQTIAAFGRDNLQSALRSILADFVQELLNEPPDQRS